MTAIDEIAAERRRQRSALEIDLEYAKSALSDAQEAHDQIIAEIERLDRSEQGEKDHG